MNEPLVCAIMLTRDRPAMAARAVRAFREQTYRPRMLFILDSGTKGVAFSTPGCEPDEDGEFPDTPRGYLVRYPSLLSKTATIGALRNEAARLAIAGGPLDIIVHWDDDDWSHPNRIAEQVALLQSSGADAVGYREMLFWRDIQLSEHDVYGDGGDPSRPCDVIEEAWLYSHSRPDYALGTSLCYWRKTWERKPFPDLPKGPGATGEDHEWRQGLKVASEPSSGYMTDKGPGVEPRMIASIHGGNSSKAYDIEALLAKGNKQWRRAPDWDDFCRKAMQL